MCKVYVHEKRASEVVCDAGKVFHMSVQRVCCVVSSLPWTLEHVPQPRDRITTVCDGCYGLLGALSSV